MRSGSVISAMTRNVSPRTGYSGSLQTLAFTRSLDCLWRADQCLFLVEKVYIRKQPITSNVFKSLFFCTKYSWREYCSVAYCVAKRLVTVSQVCSDSNNGHENKNTGGFADALDGGDKYRRYTQLVRKFTSKTMM